MSLGAPDGTPLEPDIVARQQQMGDSSYESSHKNDEEVSLETHDPLSHMSDIDRWGLKGWSFMMNNFPDYSALVNGSNITNLGFDLNSSE